MADGQRTIAVLGATGDQGYGLALRWAQAGQRVIIGSRAAERAVDAANRIKAALGDSVNVEGMVNPEAVAAADFIVISVPFGGQADTIKAVRESAREGQIFCDITVPLASAVGGPATRMIGLPNGSAAEQAADLLPKTVKVVSAFHNVSSDVLQELEADIECDVIVCGNADGKAVVKELLTHLKGTRYIDGGPLFNSRIVESITALLIGLNIRYKVHGAGVRFTGLPLE